MSRSRTRQLLNAAATGGAARVARLLESGVSPETRDDRGCTPLMLAARKNHTSVVLELLQHGARVDNDLQGWTALDYATAEGYSETAKLLIAHGANVRDASATLNLYGTVVGGQTPLHVAAWNGGTAAVPVLLGAGAVPTHETCRATPPLTTPPLKGTRTFFGFCSIMVRIRTTPLASTAEHFYT